MRVVHIDFDTEEWSTWKPDDPTDCEVWATVMVGDENGTNYYQIHVCTPRSIRRIGDKRHCFMIDEFRGVDELVAKLNVFIESKAGAAVDPFAALSKHWKWEYENYR
jgi:Immunity protein 8